MGGLDVFDQVRKKNMNDTQHATMKYTVRMFEVVWSMCLSQAYNIHCHVNKNRRTYQMNPTEFKIAVIKGLLSHEVVVNAQPFNIDQNLHILRQTEEGSRGDGSKRRKNGDCRGCLNSVTFDRVKTEIPRRTTYYCTKCNFFPHPDCFHPWHEQKGDDFVPCKKHHEI